jgi:4'-phosphopantetheinyl transferase
MTSAWSPSTEPVLPADDALDVWKVRLDNRRAPLADAAATLSLVERRRANQFRLDEPRQQFILTRAALRTLVGKYLGQPPEGVAIETSPAGKPHLAETHRASGLHFSVAHSDELALIAVTTGCEVGVDVERLRAVSHAEHIARRFFHPAETRAILAAGPADRDTMFLRCWTGKEAVLKAVGSGMTGSLASFCVPADEFDAAWIELPAPIAHSPQRCWLHALAPCRGYVGAVACLGHQRRVRPFVFAW